MRIKNKRNALCNGFTRFAPFFECAHNWMNRIEFKPIPFDFAGLREPNVFYSCPKAASCLSKIAFGNAVNLDRCLVQTACCIFPGACYRLTLTVESKSQIADPVAKALCLSAKNGRKENKNPILRGHYFLLTSAAI
jgi:hypothetical protein